MHVHGSGIKQIKKREKMMEEIMERLLAFKARLQEEVVALSKARENETPERSVARLAELNAIQLIKNEYDAMLVAIQPLSVRAPSPDQIQLAI